jgi:uncharacterized protein YbjT (DUF2867 family)
VKALVLGGTGYVGRRLVEDALSDPLWNRTCDSGYEAEVAARVRNRLLRKDA